MSNTTLQTSSTGTNVYVNILLLIGSFFGGMSGDTATIIVSAVMAVVAAVFAFRNWVVTAKFSLKKSWVGDPNNWAYVTAIIAGAVPAASELITPLKELANALVAGNWGNIITGAVTLLSIVYYKFLKPKAA